MQTQAYRLRFPLAQMETEHVRTAAMKKLGSILFLGILMSLPGLNPLIPQNAIADPAPCRQKYDTYLDARQPGISGAKALHGKKQKLFWSGKRVRTMQPPEKRLDIMYNHGLCLYA